MPNWEFDRCAKIVAQNRYGWMKTNKAQKFTVRVVPFFLERSYTCTLIPEVKKYTLGKDLGCECQLLRLNPTIPVYQNLVSIIN